MLSPSICAKGVAVTPVTASTSPINILSGRIQCAPLCGNTSNGQNARQSQAMAGCLCRRVNQGILGVNYGQLRILLDVYSGMLDLYLHHR